MKYYFTDEGVMGLIGGTWMLFASDSDYFEYYHEHCSE